MNKKILIGCYEIPGYGGANTVGYKLFEIMQGDGFDVSYINIINNQDSDYFRYTMGENYGNPKNLENIYNCVLSRGLFDFHTELDNLIEELSPDILLGIGYIATLLFSQASRGKSLIYFTDGCEQAKQYIALKRARDALSLYKICQKAKIQTEILHNKAREATDVSDLIITHSEMVKFFYERFYPHYSGKIHPNVIWYAEWIYEEALDNLHLKKDFSKRDIDVLFISSSWNRPVKNYDLVKKIVSQCKGLNIHVIGAIEEELANTKCHGLVTKREDLFLLLGRTKTVVCPSLFDAAPGILFEASAMGCNVITSKNCGNWKICNEKLLVDPFNLSNFLDKINLSLSRKYKDNVDYFIKGNSYQDLIDTILVF